MDRRLFDLDLAEQELDIINTWIAPEPPLPPVTCHRADALWRRLVSMKLCRSDKWRRGEASCHHTRVWWVQPHCRNHVSACWPQLAVWEADEQPSSTNGLMDISPVPQRCASVTFTHSALSCMVLTQSWHGLAFAFSLTLTEIWVQAGGYLWVCRFYKYKENDRGCVAFHFCCGTYPVYLQIFSRGFHQKRYF